MSHYPTKCNRPTTEVNIPSSLPRQNPVNTDLSTFLYINVSTIFLLLMFKTWQLHLTKSLPSPYHSPTSHHRKCFSCLSNATNACVSIFTVNNWSKPSPCYSWNIATTSPSITLPFPFQLLIETDIFNHYFS